MGGFGNWLRSVGAKIGAFFRRFMAGRYGTDKLNMLLLGIGVMASLLSVLIPFAPVCLTLSLISYILMGWVIFRTLSRNTYKRYQENRRFLLWKQKLTDRQHRYYNCPRCRQQVRVPRGKGKISITCPKCKEKFIKKR